MFDISRRWAAWGARVRGGAVAAEAVAVTAGTCLEHAVRAHTRLVPWMALNAVAHGDLAHLRTLASSGRLGHGDAAIVDAARLLAQELLAAASDDAELLVLLQRMLLVPLELDLLRVSESGNVTIGTVVGATRAVLGGRRV